MKIYTAGPITGLSYAQVMDRYESQAARLREYGYEVLCPMVCKGFLKDEESLDGFGYDHPTATNRAIKGRDKWMVKQSDIVLVDFTQAVVASIGSCMEIAWAEEYNKHVIAVLPQDNVHRHAFILESVDVIFEDIYEAYGYLKGLAKGI
jgi:nucleoside 2-deoxyribosyltransferase